MKLCCLQENGTGDHHVKLIEPDSERQISHVFAHMCNLNFKKDIILNIYIYIYMKTAYQTLVEK
jgi:hypothetical protein